MQQLENMKVVLSGGGTGGHIYPAVAIANAIRLRNPNTSILFVGAKGRMEMEKVPASGYPIRGILISGLQRRFTFYNIVVPFKVMSSLYNAYIILKEFQPDVVIGTGGYASGPALSVASWLGIPTIIQEQNSFPGITNKILAKKATKICVAYPDMEKYFPASKIMLTGNPVRKDIETLSISKATACKFFNLNPDKLTLLVIGGSLGAKTINQGIYTGLGQLAAHNIQLIWQTGKPFTLEAMKSIGGYVGKGMLTRPFISEMDRAYAAADIVVSRAGALAISELCATGKPSILVPSPNVAEDHQTKNALALTTRDAAILVSDKDAPEMLLTTILNLADDISLQQKLSNNISRLAFHNAADQIASLAFTLALSKK